MKYIHDSLFDDTVAMLFQIIVKKESPDDLPVTFKGSFFTEEDLDSSRPLETLLDGLETALHLHVYENEDPIILKKQLLDACSDEKLIWDDAPKYLDLKVEQQISTKYETIIIREKV